ncbi:hypothetical protein [Paenibacillus sp.]|uniref:hypothetical protein n=1 Tax=Paenibacillus sp. TaxID=58172 RepID=UPI002810C95C|nr:hypothetical protein [Paenibacillus sp.]
MAKQPAYVLVTVDPTSPNQTVIGYDASFQDPAFSPIGYGGADVLGALAQGGFEIQEIVAGDDYVQYILFNKKFKDKEREALTEAYENLPFEPVT